MKAIEFKEQNGALSRKDSPLRPIPIFKDPSEKAQVVSCWKLSFKERMRLLLLGKLWVSIITYNNPVQPSLFSTRKEDVLR